MRKSISELVSSLNSEAQMNKQSVLAEAFNILR